MDKVKNWSSNQWKAHLKELEVDRIEFLLNRHETVEAMPDDYYREGFSELIGTNDSSKLSKMVSLLMRSLTERQQIVLRLIYWESMSLNEISVFLGISKSGVKDIRNRSLAKLLKILMEYQKKIEENTKPLQANDLKKAELHQKTVTSVR